MINELSRDTSTSKVVVDGNLAKKDGVRVRTSPRWSAKGDALGDDAPFDLEDEVVVIGVQKRIAQVTSNRSSLARRSTLGGVALRPVQLLVEVVGDGEIPSLCSTHDVLVSTPSSTFA